MAREYSFPARVASPRPANGLAIPLFACVFSPLRVSFNPYMLPSLQYSDEDADESSKKSKDASSKTADRESGQQLEEGPILKHDHSYIRHWLYLYVSEHIKVSARRIKIQLLSPCLYGTFSLDDKVNCGVCIFSLAYVRVSVCVLQEYFLFMHAC